jgi:ferredoxin
MNSFQDITEKLRKRARALLESGEVGAVIAYERGTVPLMSRPVIIRKPEDAGRLVFDGACFINLANFVRGHSGKVAVLAKGCDSRALCALLKEQQIKREDMHILGAPCGGMVDRVKVQERVGNREIISAEEKGDSIIIKGDGFEETVPRSDVLYAHCETCAHPNPVIHDELLGGEVRKKNADPFERVAEVEALPPNERWKRFAAEISRCIRCYACREACPLCYCKTCVIDDRAPSWLGSTLGEADVAAFHVIRAFHTAGRCTDCGNCSAVCPMGIGVSLLAGKLSKDVRDLFGVEINVDAETPPPLESYSMDDPNDMFM